MEKTWPESKLQTCRWKFCNVRICFSKARLALSDARASSQLLHPPRRRTHPKTSASEGLHSAQISAACRPSHPPPKLHGSHGAWLAPGGHAQHGASPSTLQSGLAKRFEVQVKSFSPLVRQSRRRYGAGLTAKESKPALDHVDCKPEPFLVGVVLLPRSSALCLTFHSCFEICITSSISQRPFFHQLLFLNSAQCC